MCIIFILVHTLCSYVHVYIIGSTGASGAANVVTHGMRPREDHAILAARLHAQNAADASACHGTTNYTVC